MTNNDTKKIFEAMYYVGIAVIVISHLYLFSQKYMDETAIRIHAGVNLVAAGLIITHFIWNKNNEKEDGSVP